MKWDEVLKANTGRTLTPEEITLWYQSLGETEARLSGVINWAFSDAGRVRRYKKPAYAYTLSDIRWWFKECNQFFRENRAQSAGYCAVCENKEWFLVIEQTSGEYLTWQDYDTQVSNALAASTPTPSVRRYMMPCLCPRGLQRTPQTWAARSHAYDWYKSQVYGEKDDNNVDTN